MQTSVIGVIAHRGGAGLRVENTLAAFANAVAVGAVGAELDARFSADGQVVVHHDACLNPSYCRYLGGDWLENGIELPVANFDLSALRGFDIGTPKPDSDYAQRFDRIRPAPGQRVPLLREVIRLVRDRSDKFFLVIEIKTSLLEADTEGARRLVDAVLEIVEQEQFGHRFRLCSFDWGALRYAIDQRAATRAWFTTHPLSWYSKMPPPPCDIPPHSDYLRLFREAYSRGARWFGDFDPRDFGGGYAEAIATACGEAWLLYHTDCGPTRVREARSYGLSSSAWSVNLRDPDAVAALEHAGADWVCLDYPDMYQSER